MRLVDKGMVVLARAEADALELSQHPEELSKLIRAGSLFTVPSGTAITVRQAEKDVFNVQIIEAPWRDKRDGLKPDR